MNIDAYESKQKHISLASMHSGIKEMIVINDSIIDAFTGKSILVGRWFSNHHFYKEPVQKVLCQYQT